jgi:hypothetical protein
MFSLIFFVFVAFVAAAGFAAISWRRRRNKKRLQAGQENASTATDYRSTMGSNGNLSRNVRDEFVPAGHKPGQNDPAEDSGTGN